MPMLTDFDIAGRDEGRAQLANLLREFRVVLNAIEYGILFMDHDLRVRLANRAFCDMWKIPAALIAKKPTMRRMMEELRRRGIYDLPGDSWEEFVQARIEAVRADRRGAARQRGTLRSRHAGLERSAVGLGCRE
jgi:PAS domain-containing protein